ncbi:efflux RND transporter periplasmic adaptor subunit [Vibrio sp. WXL210]|uniref:efflux RND transporter periplasmic adaptor subunit n=1 Tax=Vibrio sp. WXL210 TaxID=3450709 RepID=UPI003EC772AE
MTHSASLPNQGARRLVSTAIKVILPCCVLGAGIYITQELLKGRPHHQRPPGQPPARLVDVESIRLGKVSPQVIGRGEVQPKRTVSLRSQLRGTINDLPSHLFPGGYVAQGEPLVTLDKRDFSLAVEQAEALLARKEALYDVELGRRRAAEMEYELSGQTLNPEDLALVLRQPQLAQIEADIAHSKAAVEQAKLNLERTEITAPFDGQIVDISAATGSQVRDNTVLMDIVATDSFWLSVSLPSQQLRWLTIPPAGAPIHSSKSCYGSSVKITNPNEWGEGQYRQGCVTSLLPELDKRIKTASVLVRIDDPLAQKPENIDKPSVLLNAFLQAEFQVNPVARAVELPRRYLQKDSFVWLMDSDDQLEAREVTIAHRSQDSVLITFGLNPGDKLVTTPLIGAIEGIALKQRPHRQSLATTKESKPTPEAQGAHSS